MADLDWLGVGLAVGAAFGLGALWYGPLFGRPWRRLSGATDAAGANPGLVYGAAFALQAVAVVVLALFLGPDHGPLDGLALGLHVGAAFVATALGVTYLFSQKPLALWAIDAGYHVAYYALAGAILGAV